MAIRANAGLCVYAPEQPIIRGRYGGVVFRFYELPLPAQRRTELFAMDVEAL
jgi:hypothetical protein